MVDTPLAPIESPLVVLSRLGLPDFGFSFTSAILSVVLGIWFVYTLVVIYHWVKYSHGARVAIPAIMAHLVISAVLITYTLSGTLV